MSSEREQQGKEGRGVLGTVTATTPEKAVCRAPRNGEGRARADAVEAVGRKGQDA